MAITQRDPRKLTADDLRALVRYINGTNENLWFPTDYAENPVTLAQILAGYHAAYDAGYIDLETWLRADDEVYRGQAWETWNRIRKAKKYR